MRVSAGPGDQATAHVRQRSFEIGAPVCFDSQYRHVSALEHLLGAVAADLLNGLRVLAQKRRVVLDNAEAVARVQLQNPLVHLGVIGERGNAGLERLEVKVYVDAAAPQAVIEELWAETLRRSPLARTFGELTGFQPVLALA